MAYIESLKILLVYCMGNDIKKSKIIKLSCEKNHESSLILGSFIGSKSYYKTISVNQDQTKVYLNENNESIRVLSQYKNGNFELDVSIPIQHKINQILPYGENKVLLLDYDSKISIMEIIPEEAKSRFLVKRGTIYSRAEQEHKENLEKITFCPKEEYICATSKKPSNAKNAYGFTKLYILRIKHKENGTLALEKLFQLAFSYNFPKAADVLIPFYYKGFPVLAILEEKVGSRVYFYKFTGRECKKLGNTVVGTNVGCNQVVALRGSLNIFKILKSGLVYKVTIR